MLTTIIIYYIGYIIALIIAIPSRSRYIAFVALLSWLFVAIWVVGVLTSKK